jgi:CelD/BcsL family acetyltransferase involved in cellulose biosynthesis
MVGAALRANRRRWDCLWLPLLAGWTGAHERLARLTNGSLRCYVHERGAEFAGLALPETHEAYLGSLSANARSNLRRGAKRLAADGARVECVRCERAEQLPEMLAALFDLHQRRWQVDGVPGCFGAGSRLTRFYTGFAPAALRSGWLRLYALRVDGVIRAVQYGYAYAGTFYQLQEGYDPDAPEGTGNVLREHVFKASIEEGLTNYDFLGEFTEHKRRWGATPRAGYDLFIGRPQLKNSLLFARPIWPTGRFLREEFPPARGAAESGWPLGGNAPDDVRTIAATVDAQSARAHGA